MPPPNSGVPPLTTDEKMTIARWIDLGCPINFGQESGHGTWGWFLDDLRPALTISSPRPGVTTTVSEICFGAADAYTGINPASLIVRATFPVAGRAPWSELRDLVRQSGDGIYSLPVSPALTTAQDARVYVAIKDKRKPSLAIPGAKGLSCRAWQRLIETIVMEELDGSIEEMTEGGIC